MPCGIQSSNRQLMPCCPNLPLCSPSSRHAVCGSRLVRDLARVPTPARHPKSPQCRSSQETREASSGITLNKDRLQPCDGETVAQTETSNETCLILVDESSIAQRHPLEGPKQCTRKRSLTRWGRSDKWPSPWSCEKRGLLHLCDRDHHCAGVRGETGLT